MIRRGSPGCQAGIPGFFIKKEIYDIFFDRQRLIDRSSYGIVHFIG